MKQARFSHVSLPVFRINRLMFYGLLCAAGLYCLSCTRPDLIGSDLLKDETSNVGFTDTVSLHCTMVPGDPVLTYHAESGTVQTTRSLIGHLNDPFFGVSDASVFTDIFLVASSSAFVGNVIDSVVLSLRYDTLGLYGDMSQPVEFEVYEMLEEFNTGSDIKSDYAPMIGSEPIGSGTFMPRPYDSINVQVRGDTLRYPPMARIQMSPQFIETLAAQDSATFESADSFRNWIKGLHVRMSQGENTMLSFDLRSTWSGLTIFYENQVDTMQHTVNFAFTDGLGGGIRHAYFQHDYSGSVVQNFVDHPELADSLLFVQGMAGMTLRVSLPGLLNIPDILINKAELEFYTADLPDDDLVLYPQVPQLINAVKDENGDTQFSEDVSLTLSRLGSLSVYGGALTEIDSLNTGLQKYTMNVTTSLQDIYKGRIDNQFLIIPYPKVNTSGRVILYGPGNPQYPARLKLTYTVVK